MNRFIKDLINKQTNKRLISSIYLYLQKMNQTKLSKGPPSRLVYGDPRNFAKRRFQKKIKLPGEAPRWIIAREQGIIEDFILSMNDGKKEVYGIHSVKPEKSNFFTKRFLRL